jgi:leader peptidase (prepilin peptidase)/N-methyltransferase
VNSVAAAVFDLQMWASLPFHFWTAVFFVFGSMVGSFLNVCIHRMPRGESIVTPPSHCPGCGASIRWWQNIPLFSWLALRGECAGCGIRISPRYVLVEALTGVLFAVLWVQHGQVSVMGVLALSVFTAGLIVATFIDFEHLIIPDEITLGGTAVGVVCSVIAPSIQSQTYVWPALKASLIGLVVGAGVVFAILELGKLLFGRQRLTLPEGSRMVFTETDLHLPDRVLPYEEVFFRVSDTLVFHAGRLELPDRCYQSVMVRLKLRAGRLFIGEEEVDASTVPWMEALTDQVTVPREAMGWGDVKFMAAIGAFTGWQGVMFTLLASSIAGLMVNLGMILMRRRQWSAQIPFGPYLALGALLWAVGAREWWGAWFFLGARI